MPGLKGEMVKRTGARVKGESMGSVKGLTNKLSPLKWPAIISGV